ncbi:MAG: acyltransferase [Actinobacteria bacterium]|nr:MAG: acyltransferase [Actinomycetota bacterium]
MTPARLRDLRREVFLRRAARRVGAHRLAAFGPTSLIVPPAVIHSPHRIEIGRRVILHRDAFLSVVEEHNGRRYSPHLRIGDGTSFGHGLWISCVGEIDIGREVLAGHNILITDTHHEYHDPDTAIVHQPMAPPRPVRIGDGAHLGPHVAVLAGVTIGERAFVAANAVVTRDVPPNAVAVGNPARVIRRYDRARGVWVDED